MLNQGNLALAQNQEDALVFQFPNMQTSADFSQEDLAEDTDGVHVSFPRVKIPSGGMLQFELPSEDSAKPEYVSSLVGVLLYHHAANGYWVGEPDDEDKSPLCSSVDGKTGIGDPGGLCVKCSLNKFGSGDDGKSKACKNMRHLYLLRSGEFMPLMLSLPPTSLRPFNEFMNSAFLYRNRASWGSVVEIGLRREERPTPHSVAEFRKLYDFSGQELAEVKAFVSNFRAQAKVMLEERARAAEEQRSEGCDYAGFDQKVSGGDGTFVINGSHEELPL